MARDDLFFDPLQNEPGEAAPVPEEPSRPDTPALRRSQELLRVRRDLEKMLHTGHRT